VSVLFSGQMGACRRATSDIVIPGSLVSARIARFCSRDQDRRVLAIAM
jgi:hypothetical protein